MINTQTILDRVLSGERLTAEQCTALIESHDVALVGAAADQIRQRRHCGRFERRGGVDFEPVDELKR